MVVPSKAIEGVSAAFVSRAGPVAKADVVVHDVAAEIAGLQASLVELQSAVRVAKVSAAVGDAVRGPQLLDTSLLAGGPFPSGAPVLDVRRGPELLRAGVFQSVPVASLVSDLDRVLARALHRDAARVIGRPLVQVGDSGVAGGAAMAYGRQQVGEVGGYSSIEAAAFEAVYRAARGDARGAVAAVHAATDAGAPRFVLVELDHGLVSPMAPTALRYRTEAGEQALVAGVADSDGRWHALSSDAAVDAPEASRITLMPIRELDRFSIVHYDPETAMKITELEDASVRVAGLIDALQAASSTAAARSSESLAAKVPAVVTHAPAAVTAEPVTLSHAERFNAATGSVGKADVFDRRGPTGWLMFEEHDVKEVIDNLPFVKQATFSGRTATSLYNDIVKVAKSNGYDGHATIEILNRGSTMPEPRDWILSALRSGRTADDYVAARKVDAIVEGLVGKRLRGHHGPRQSVAQSGADVAEMSAAIQRVAALNFESFYMDAMIDVVVSKRLTSHAIDELFDPWVRKAMHASWPSQLEFEDVKDAVILMALKLGARMDEVAEVADTFESLRFRNEKFESALQVVVAKRELVETLG